MLPASIILFCLTALAPAASTNALPLPSMAMQLPFRLRPVAAPRGGFFTPPFPRPSNRYTPTLRILEDDDLHIKPSFASEWDLVVPSPASASSADAAGANSEPSRKQRKSSRDIDDASIFSDLLMGPGGYDALETARVEIASPMYSGRRIPVREIGSFQRRQARKQRRATIVQSTTSTMPSKPEPTTAADSITWVAFQGVTPELPEPSQTPTFHHMHPGPVITATPGESL